MLTGNVKKGAGSSSLAITAIQYYIIHPNPLYTTRQLYLSRQRQRLLCEPRSGENRNRFKLLKTTHAALLPGNVPSLARLLVDKCALPEWIRAAGDMGLKRLQSCRLRLRSRNRRVARKRIRSRALGLKRLRCGLWSGLWWKGGCLSGRVAIKLRRRGRKPLGEGIGILES